MSFTDFWNYTLTNSSTPWRITQGNPDISDPTLQLNYYTSPSRGEIVVRDDIPDGNYVITFTFQSLNALEFIFSFNGNTSFMCPAVRHNSSGQIGTIYTRGARYGSSGSFGNWWGQSFAYNGFVDLNMTIYLNTYSRKMRAVLVNGVNTVDSGDVDVPLNINIKSLSLMSNNLIGITNHYLLLNQLVFTNVYINNGDYIIKPYIDPYDRGDFSTVHEALDNIVQTDPTTQKVNLHIRANITEPAGTDATPSWDFTNTNLKNIEIFDEFQVNSEITKGLVFHEGWPGHSHTISGAYIKYNSALSYCRLKLHDIHFKDSCLAIKGSPTTGNFDAGYAQFYNILMEGTNSVITPRFYEAALLVVDNGKDMVSGIADVPKLFNFKFWNTASTTPVLLNASNVESSSGSVSCLIQIDNFTISKTDNPNTAGIKITGGFFSPPTYAMYVINNLMLIDCYDQILSNSDYGSFKFLEIDGGGVATTTNVNLFGGNVSINGYCNFIPLKNINKTAEFISLDPTNYNFLKLNNVTIKTLGVGTWPTGSWLSYSGVVPSSLISQNTIGISYHQRPGQDGLYSIGAEEYFGCTEVGGNGLSSFDIRTNEYRHFTIADSPVNANEFISAFGLDSSGNLWLLGYDGINRKLKERFKTNF